MVSQIVYIPTAVAIPSGRVVVWKLNYYFGQQVFEFDHPSFIMKQSSDSSNNSGSDSEDKRVKKDRKRKLPVAQKQPRRPIAKKQPRIQSEPRPTTSADADIPSKSSSSSESVDFVPAEKLKVKLKVIINLHSKSDGPKLRVWFDLEFSSWAR